MTFIEKSYSFIKINFNQGRVKIVTYRVQILELIDSYLCACSILLFNKHFHSFNTKFRKLTGFYIILNISENIHRLLIALKMKNAEDTILKKVNLKLF